MLKQLFLVLGLCVMLANQTLLADSVAPPDDPRQTLAYWKPYVIDPASDAEVQQAMDLFAVLLRTWDGARIEPNLYVVHSTAGPWAASLFDGTILLSKAAIEACQQIGAERSAHLLAFILAHELAHQRADDLWHYKFFRLAGTQALAVQEQLLSGLQIDKQQLASLERQEAQADHDALIMMTTVGYEPLDVFNQQGFFTAWVEHIWDSTCASPRLSMQKKACKQASVRAIRASSQLQAVAQQSILYQLGIQAYVAGDYQKARGFFTAYGRLYPGRAVHNSIGLSYLSEVIRLDRYIRQYSQSDQPEFYFPLTLDLEPLPESFKSMITKRGATDDALNKIKMERADSLTKAISLFEKALKLEPSYKQAYINLAAAYLLDNNSYMARGIILGRYVKQFGEDVDVKLLLTIADVLEGKSSKADKQFHGLMSSVLNNHDGSHVPDNTVIYRVYKNAASFYAFNNQQTDTSQVWRQLAQQAKQFADPTLFRLALAELNSPATRSFTDVKMNKMASFQIGQQLEAEGLEQAKIQYAFWYEGEKLKFYTTPSGIHVVTDSTSRIIAAWRQTDKAELIENLTLGDDTDRAYKVLGMPTRKIPLVSGEYLAYDRYGLALQSRQGRLVSGFIYKPLSEK